MNSNLANVLCTDIMQELLLAPIPSLPVLVHVPFSYYFMYTLNTYGFHNINIDPSLTDIIEYCFIKADNTPEFLQSLVEASMVILSVSRYGIITVKKMARSTPSVTFTDTNQLMSVDVEQSILKTYEGIKLTYVLPQLSDDKEVLVVEELPIPIGVTTMNTIKYPNLVFNISAVTLSGTSNAEISRYYSTNFGLYLTTKLDNIKSATMRLSVTGKNIDLIEQELMDSYANNLLTINNEYIQTSSYADTYKDTLSRFISAEIPTLTTDIRGNPLIEIGDTIQLNSDAYNMSFTGIVKRMIFKYNGALSCTMTLLNTEVV